MMPMNRTTQAAIELLWFAGRFAVAFHRSKNAGHLGFGPQAEPDLKSRARIAWQNSKF